MSTRLSLIGLGAMGLPMARLLAKRGPITVHNRSRSRAEALAAELPAAGVAQTPAAAAAEVVLTVLPDLPDVRAVLDGPDGLLAGWQRDSIDRPLLVVMGTVSPVELRELASDLASHGVDVVDAPISGGVLGAAAGTLSVFVGGTPEQVELLADVLEPCAGRVTRMGPVGSGATAKLCNQLVVASTVAALSESFALARASGIDASTLADALGSGLAASEVLRQKREHWISESFEPGGTVDYQVKDLRYAKQSADAVGLNMRAAKSVLELFQASKDAGDGGLDHTGVYRQVIRD
ncbi:2-hydroxy-3-oxopropionate reductase [Paramicrobacterium humi]|uniref:2-hydroxy-3-oxopropionate reductase n=1 Tax=Paramicrobacterium humi TaxID=640635 RepID=A0A1H4KVT8_9MICO|nr:NAD(P)-dependent oxidoreductase [Microbacterium humi]SEB62654.1 2-hydroxy-3-oxopropionate reductase [Microbacterium humi]